MAEAKVKAEHQIRVLVDVRVARKVPVSKAM
jgi:hypothetical protein